MTLSIKFEKPTIKSAFDWQLSQEVNVVDETGTTVAKAEIEIITLNKHRDAKASYDLLEEYESTDWEIPLNLCFKKHNLNSELCEKLNVSADQKSKTHIMIEAISVVKSMRKQGIARLLLKEIAQEYAKAQSITVLSMPMSWFVDPEFCESDANTSYYQDLTLEDETLEKETISDIFKSCGFITLAVDNELLAAPLLYDILLASPQTILAK